MNIGIVSHKILSNIVRTVVTVMALTATTVTSSAAQPMETAMATADFVNSIGVNTHFNYARSYRSNAPALVALIGDSGIRHIRDGTLPYFDKGYNGILTMLAARGEKVDVMMEDSFSNQVIHNQINYFPAGMIDAFENPNELDLFRGGDLYINALRSFTPRLYEALKSDPRTRGIPVIGPSLTTVRAYTTLGDLNAYMDFGNLHNYVFGRPPGTDGFGPTHYGTIAHMMDAAKIVAGPKPIMTTEAGWGTSSKSGEVTEAVQLKYLQRFFFEQALHGIRRSYTYEFYDEGSTYNTYGLVRNDLSPKPSFTGLRNLIKLMNDSGEPRRDRVSVSVEGPATVHHMLLEKSDGRRYLAVWNEVSSIAIRAGAEEREEQNEAQSTQIALDGSHVDVYGFDRDGAVTHSTLAGNTGKYTYAVSDSVSILSWLPSDKSSAAR